MPEIKKPWCICLGVMFFEQGIGRVEKEDGDTAWVRYTEKQLYLPEAWDKDYLLRFNTLIKAVKEFAKRTDNSVQRISYLIGIAFPSMEKELRQAAGARRSGQGRIVKR